MMCGGLPMLPVLVPGSSTRRASVVVGIDVIDRRFAAIDSPRLTLRRRGSRANLISRQELRFQRHLAFPDFLRVCHISTMFARGDLEKLRKSDFSRLFAGLWLAPPRPRRHLSHHWHSPWRPTNDARVRANWTTHTTHGSPYSAC